MKNQYFGDKRDLFKHDLVMEIMGAGLARRFVYIPMLTAADGSNDGRLNLSGAKVGLKNRELLGFLDGCVREGRRDVGQLAGFYKQRGIDISLFASGFSHEGRQAYFEQAGKELSPGSLILVDPDIGLEVSRSREKHLLYREAQELYRRMDASSILMLYQHFPRQEHHQYLHRMPRVIMERISGVEPVCIDDDEIIFFILTKDEGLEHSLVHTIGDYAERYS